MPVVSSLLVLYQTKRLETSTSKTRTQKSKNLTPSSLIQCAYLAPNRENGENPILYHGETFLISWGRICGGNFVSCRTFYFAGIIPAEDVFVALCFRSHRRLFGAGSLQRVRTEKILSQSSRRAIFFACSTRWEGFSQHLFRGSITSSLPISQCSMQIN